MIQAGFHSISVSLFPRGEAPRFRIRTHGSGFGAFVLGVSSLGCRTYDEAFRAPGFEISEPQAPKPQISELSSVLGSRMGGSEFRVSGLGFRGLGFRV